MSSYTISKPVMGSARGRHSMLGGRTVLVGGDVINMGNSFTDMLKSALPSGAVLARMANRAVQNPSANANQISPENPAPIDPPGGLPSPSIAKPPFVFTKTMKIGAGVAAGLVLLMVLKGKGGKSGG